MKRTRRLALWTLSAGLAGCSRPAPVPEVPVRRFKLGGVVRRLDLTRDIAVIRHEAIEGWMEAMTMEFPVRDKAGFAKLAEGSRVQATVNVQELDYWLTDIQVE